MIPLARAYRCPVCGSPSQETPHLHPTAVGFVRGAR